MKPDGDLSGDMEDIDPSELFIQLGTLVVESRLPEKTAKGRRQGPHCPLAVGETNWHVCRTDNFQCRKARAMRKEMLTLWRNRVPMCIEVTLLPECGHGMERVMNSDVSIPTDQGGSLLLEKWTIQIFPRRSTDNPVSIKVLFQAVQSHLCFSQLSAWLNLTQGNFPSNVCYRISPPGDFCTSSFSQTPVCHTFPLATVSKSHCIKVTAGGLPRMTEIPHIRCREPHGEKSATEEGATGGSSPMPISGVASASMTQRYERRTPPRTDRNSAQYHKPKVVQEPKASEPRRNDVMVQGVARDKETDMSYDSRSAKSPQGLLSYVNRDYATSPAQHTGAIPKRLSHKSPPPPPYYESDYASSAPQLESLVKGEEGSANNHASTSKSTDFTSPKVIVTHKSPSQVYYSKDKVNHCKDKVNWILQNVVNKDSSTDSDSSSPDIDRYLNKTLASRLDPLSPAEMENYLENLCTTASSRSKREHDMQTSSEHVHHCTMLNQCYLPNRHSPPNSSMCNSKKQNDDLQDISLSFKSLLNETAQNMSRPEDLELRLSNKQSSKRKEKSKSVSDDSGEFKVTPTRDDLTSLKLLQPDVVKFTLDDDAEVESEPSKYSRLSYRNGADNIDMVTNGNSCQATTTNASQPPDYLEEDDDNDQDTVGYSLNLQNGASQTSGESSQNSKLPFHKSVSCPGGAHRGFSLVPSHMIGNNASSLFRTVMRKDVTQNEQVEGEALELKKSMPIPTDFERVSFQKNLHSSANMIFHAATGLPMQSSPAPIKKRASDNFDYDGSLTNPRAIKNSISCVNLDEQKGEDGRGGCNQNQRLYSTSAPASTNCLLGNFEESMLNGRLEPSGVVEGFTADIGASGNFCPKHSSLPVTAFFFSLSDDNAPSPYLGHINLDMLGKRGYHVPKKGTVQVTLFNPNKTVLKMFVVVYDLGDMPPNCQTFLRQRTLYMPVRGSPCDEADAPVYLRYLIHLRFSSSKSGKTYLHTDIRLIFARDKLEFDSSVANYELRSFTEGPTNPKFSPKR